MIVREVSPEDARDQLDAALGDVELANPGGTAAVSVTRVQRRVAVVAAVVLVASLVVVPGGTLVVLASLATVIYLITVAHRVRLVRAALRDDPSIHITDAVARAIPDDALPIYTVLVPAYHEPEVVAGLIVALERLDYPRDRLDIKLLLECDDDATLLAAEMVETDLPVEILVLPEGAPRTKPRALDYGLRFASGELVTIYDAEDHPEPLQLRRAVAAFGTAGPEVACLQARLSFYGGTRNLLSRWFTAEYATWFDLYLPGLILTGAPVPLGGTSNHFVRRALREVGGWDPYNVTEDCDLGIRLQRQRLLDRSARFDDDGRAEHRRHQLGQAAQPLVQGVPADAARRVA